MIRATLQNGLAEIGMSLSEEQLQSFERFADELKKWNKKVNLTSICKDGDIAIKHIIDSLVLAVCVDDGVCVLDIGSGAGFPAIPLKIIKPQVRVVSVDAVGKKIMFQRHVARLLGLDKFEALHARVESLHATHAGFFDVISSRAFSRLDVFVSLAAPLLKNGGKIIAMKGPEICSEIDSSMNDLHHLGFEIASLQEYSLPLDKGKRTLVTITAAKAHK